MSDRMDGALGAAEAARRELLDFVASLPAPVVSQRAEGDAWSPLEILEHLRLTEDGVVRLLSHRVTRARERGLGPTVHSLSHDGDDIFLPDIRIGAPEALLPTGDLTLSAVLRGLSTSRDALRRLVAEVRPFDGTQVTARHLVLGEIHFYQWVHFIGNHDRRHQRQISRLVGIA